MLLSCISRSALKIAGRSPPAPQSLFETTSSSSSCAQNGRNSGNLCCGRFWTYVSHLRSSSSSKSVLPPNGSTPSTNRTRKSAYGCLAAATPSSVVATSSSATSNSPFMTYCTSAAPSIIPRPTSDARNRSAASALNLSPPTPASAYRQSTTSSSTPSTKVDSSLPATIMPSSTP